MKKRVKKTQKELETLGEKYIIDKLKKSIEILEKETINSDEMDMLATTAYEFFLIAHWSMLDYVADAEKQAVIYELTNTVYHHLLAPPDNDLTD